MPHRGVGRRRINDFVIIQLLPSLFTIDSPTQARCFNLPQSAGFSLGQNGEHFHSPPRTWGSVQTFPPSNMVTHKDFHRVVSQSIGVAITKYHRLGWLEISRFIFQFLEHKSPRLQCGDCYFWYVDGYLIVVISHDGRDEGAL